MSQNQIKVVVENQDIILKIEDTRPHSVKLGEIPIADVTITLDMFEAKSLAYSILAKVCHIEKDMLQ